MARKQLVVPPGQRLPDPAPPGGLYLRFGQTRAACYPLRCVSGPPLGGPPGEMRHASLPPDLVGDVGGVAGPPLCHLLGQAVREFIVGHPLVSRAPSDDDLVLSGHSARAHLYRHTSLVLAWPGASAVIRQIADWEYEKIIYFRPDSNLALRA